MHLQEPYYNPSQQRMVFYGQYTEGPFATGFPLRSRALDVPFFIKVFFAGMRYVDQEPYLRINKYSHHEGNKFASLG